MGKILWVDLTHGEIYEETIADEIYQRFLSGIAWRHIFSTVTFQRELTRWDLKTSLLLSPGF